MSLILFQEFLRELENEGIKVNKLKLKNVKESIKLYKVLNK